MRGRILIQLPVTHVVQIEDVITAGADAAHDMGARLVGGVRSTWYEVICMDGGPPIEIINYLFDMESL